jgi:hypothetical protein
MQSYYITHYINEQLPEGDERKQISFLIATPESYAIGVFYYGYSGRRKLTEQELSEELAEKRIIKLRKPIIVSDKKYLWIDGNGILWLSTDNLGKVELEKAETNAKKALVVINPLGQKKLANPVYQIPRKHNQYK